MKITNDQIEIEVSDISALSAQLQTDVAFRAGPQTSSHEYLSARFNAVLEESTHLSLKSALEEINEVCVAIVKADQSTQDQIKTLLGITIQAQPKAA